MRRRAMSIGWPRRDPRHYRFTVPNAVWEYKLKPIEFVIFSYLCYHRTPRVLTPEMIAADVHMTASTVQKYLNSLVSKNLAREDGTPATPATTDGAELLNTGDQYLKYIAERPRSHGLFSNVQDTDLEKTMQEVNSHPAPVWTFIYSLKREDAARLGYDSAESWRKLLLAHQTELAEAMKIPPNQFRWCAAFHDEKHHPHVHMMVWSADPKQGYLTEQGIEAMRSKLTNDIFQDELLHLYKQKDLSYQEVRDTAQEAMRDLIREMKSGICNCPAIEDKLVTLSEMLQDVKGKKVHGYLNKPVKAQVDVIVDELARLPAVAECYEVWNKLRDELENYYKDRPRERLPLSQQKEFRAIKNMVIREAEHIRLGEITFEDEQMDDELSEEEEVLAPQTHWQMVNAYREAKYVLDDDEASWTEQEEAVQTLEQLWGAGLTVAAHQLGKCWRDGLGVLPDSNKAELWFRRSAEEYKGPSMSM